MSNLTVHLADTDPLSREALRVLQRCLAERGVVVSDAPAASAQLCLCVEPGPGSEGYHITETAGAIHITGHDPHGLFYGVGRFLHTSSFGVAGFVPSAWRGVSRPDCSLRGMYLAHNFHNWYRSAPLTDLESYLEELALWGLNAIVVPAGTNPHSPAEEVYGTMIPKQVEMLKAARRLGIRVGLLATSVIDREPDPAIAAIPVPDSTPAKRGNVGQRVCLSHPDGFHAMREQFEHNLALYAGVGLDFVTAFPYDEGGCGCADCYPWGAKGYLRFCRLFSELARKHYPGCQFIAGTWGFDVREEADGEFDGLDAALRADASWCDYIMTDAHESFPAWPLEHGSPGGLPMINFAEISMWGRFPWGGSGANPFPRRLLDIWSHSRHLLDGGLPYSEGRFEDINKVTCLRLFWDKSAGVDAIIHDYAGYEYGDDLPEIAEAIRLLEENYPSEELNEARATRALALLETAESRMTAVARAGWRWRILLLRAIIDVETVRCSEVISLRRNAAYEELLTLYCAQTGQVCVVPRAKSAYENGLLGDAHPRYEE